MIVFFVIVFQIMIVIMVVNEFFTVNLITHRLYDDLDI